MSFFSRFLRFGEFLRGPLFLFFFFFFFWGGGFFLVEKFYSVSSKFASESMVTGRLIVFQIDLVFFFHKASNACVK